MQGNMKARGQLISLELQVKNKSCHLPASQGAVQNNSNTGPQSFTSVTCRINISIPLLALYVSSDVAKVIS